MNALMLLSAWSDKIPSESAFMLQKQLENIDEKAMTSLSMVQLKEPFIGLILGLLLGAFGADRFYKGDIGLGVAKLILTLTVFGIIITAVWVIVDLFLVYKGIKQDNLQKIMQILAFAKKG